MEVLYGHHPVLEALRAGRRQIQRLLLAEGMKESGDVAEIARLAVQVRIPMERVKRGRLDALGSNLNHQGVAAQVSQYPYVELGDILQAASDSGEPPFLLLLDRIQDPQNVGTLLRTAEAAGVHGVAIPKHRAAEITPAVSMASAGAVELLRIAMVTNMTRTVDELKEAGVWVAGLERTSAALNYDQARWDGALALVVGSEGSGLSRLVAEHCDFLVQLPMRGRIGSLNASVAGSIALYLAWQARSGKGT